MPKKKLFALLPIGFLLLISLLSHLEWLNPWAIISNGDNWYLYPQALPTTNFSTWTSYLLLGGVNVQYSLYFLSFVFQFVGKLGGNMQMVNQILYYFPIVVIAPVTIYYLLCDLTKSKVASFCSSLVFIFSTYFLVVQNGGLLLAVAYSFVPGVFLFFNRFVATRETINGILFAIFYSIIIVYDLRIVYLLFFVLLFYLLFLFAIEYKKNFFNKLSSFIWNSKFLIIIFLLINSYLYIPLFFTSIASDTSATTGRDLFGANYYTLENPLTTMHPFWTGASPAEFISQPIPWYFWVYPLFAFILIIFAKKDKKIYFFFLLALITVFLGKSSSPPFGILYYWLFLHFPGFSFFREPSKIWTLIDFSYAILIAYAINGIINLIKKKFTKRKIQIILQLLVILPLCVITLWIGKSAFTTQLGPMFRSATLSKEHEYLKNFISNQKDYFRTLYVPYIYRYGYTSEIHPMLGLYALPQNFQNFNKQLLSLLSVKYLIVPEDAANDIYRSWGNKNLYLNMTQQASFKKVNNPNFGNFVVYENDNYLPHFSTTTNLTYVLKNNASLSQLMDVTKISNGIFYISTFAQQKSNSKIDTSDKNNSSEEIITAGCNSCVKASFVLPQVPFARFLPGSIFYSFILNKEDMQLNSTTNRQEYLQTAAFFSIKRTDELRKLITVDARKTNNTNISISLKRQYLLLSDIYPYLIKSTITTETNGIIYYYFNSQLQSLNSFVSFSTISSENQKQLKKNILLTKAILDRLAKNQSTNGFDKFTLFVPSSGNYNIAINESGAQLKSVHLDNKLLTASNQTKNKYNSISISSGSHIISVSKTVENYVSKSEITLGNTGQKNIFYKIPFKTLEENKNYSLSYKYQATGDVKIITSVILGSGKFLNASTIAFPENPASTKWLLFNNQFNTKITEKNGYLLLKIKKVNTSAIANIKNIIINQIDPPNVTAEMEKISKVKYAPSISFQMINPAKYIVHISNAKNPFYLIFSENYDVAWEAEYDDAVTSASGPVVYKKNNVTEIQPKNQLDLFAFMSLFKQNKKADHFAIDDTINGWYINKTGTYNLEIDFSPQRIFSLSVVIALISFFVTIVVLIIFLIKKWKH